MRRLKAEFEMSSAEVCAPKCYDAFIQVGFLKTRQKNSASFKSDSGFLQVSCLTEQKLFNKLRLFRLEKNRLTDHFCTPTCRKANQTFRRIRVMKAYRVLDPGLGPTSSRVLNPPCPSSPAPALNIHQRWSSRPTASLWLRLLLRDEDPPVPNVVWRVEAQTDGDVSNMSSRLFNPSNTLKCLKRRGGGDKTWVSFSHLREKGSTVQRWQGRRSSNGFHVEGGVRRPGCCDQRRRPSLAFLCWRTGWSSAGRLGLPQLHQRRTKVEEEDRRRSPAQQEEEEEREEVEASCAILDTRKEEWEHERRSGVSGCWLHKDKNWFKSLTGLIGVCSTLWRFWTRNTREMFWST